MMHESSVVIRKEDGTSFTGAEVLMLLGESMHHDSLSPVEKDLARRSIEGVMTACRQSGYPKAEILETMLVMGAARERRLALCCEAVAHMGSEALLATLWEVSGETRH